MNRNKKGKIKKYTFVPTNYYYYYYYFRIKPRGQTANTHVNLYNTYEDDSSHTCGAARLTGDTLIHNDKRSIGRLYVHTILNYTLSYCLGVPMLLAHT